MKLRCLQCAGEVNISRFNEGEYVFTFDEYGVHKVFIEEVRIQIVKMEGSDTFIEIQYKTVYENHPTLKRKDNVSEDKLFRTKQELIATL